MRYWYRRTPVVRLGLTVLSLPGAVSYLKLIDEALVLDRQLNHDLRLYEPVRGAGDRELEITARNSAFLQAPRDLHPALLTAAPMEAGREALNRYSASLPMLAVL